MEESMMTQSRLSEFARSFGETYALSVYLDGTTSAPGERRRWRTTLDQSLHALRASLVDKSHAEREALDRAIAHLDALLASLDGAIGQPGWVAFITAEGVRHAEGLPVGVPASTTWGPGLAIAPYVHALSADAPAVAIVVDARKAKVYRIERGAITHTETVPAHHSTPHQGHMGRAPRTGFHPGTRGGTERDQAKHALAEGSAQMYREAVRAALAAATPSAWLLVAGTKRSREDVFKRLEAVAPDRVLSLEGLDIHASQPKILAAVLAGVVVLRNARDEREVATVIEAAGDRSQGVLGPAATIHALEQGRVAALYITPRFQRVRPVQAEQAIRAAVGQHAMIREADDGAGDRVDGYGGLCARLRYRTDRVPGARPD
jgi:hypothetical protein